MAGVLVLPHNISLFFLASMLVVIVGEKQLIDLALWA
jgi:hypothetical protein